MALPEYFIPILIAIIGSTGFWQLIHALMEKRSGTAAKLDKLESMIQCLSDKGDERSAVSARIRILRFSDELQEGRLHSKDSYDQCLADITEYELYCAGHPDFKNNQTARTIAYIQRNYDERLERRDFL